MTDQLWRPWTGSLAIQEGRGPLTVKLARGSEATPVRSLVVRRALAFFLPVAVLATLCCGFVYTAVQQDLRMGANDPQLQLAEDAAAFLDEALA